MANINDGLLWFEAPDRTEAQLKAGLLAAHCVIAEAGADIEEAHRASWLPEALHETRRRMTEREDRLYQLWWAANDAAVVASGAPHGYLFPADLGKERNRSSHANLASGYALEVIPPPDRGPYFTAEPPRRETVAV